MGKVLFAYLTEQFKGKSSIARYRVNHIPDYSRYFDEDPANPRALYFKDDSLLKEIRMI